MLLLAGLAAIAFVVGVHPFLATNSRVAADSTVRRVGFPPTSCTQPSGNLAEASYSHILVSGLEAEGGVEGDATTAARHLVAGGVSATKVIANPPLRQ